MFSPAILNESSLRLIELVGILNFSEKSISFFLRYNEPVVAATAVTAPIATAV